MKRDYLATFITEALVIGSYLLTFRIVAAHLAESGFAEYALARRTLSLISPLGVLGVDLAIARFVAYAVSNRVSSNRQYAFAGLCLIGGAVVSLSSVLLLFREAFAALFFGSPSYVGLIMPLPLMLAGAGLHGVAYGYLRGQLQIQRANFLMGLNQAVVPLLAVLLASATVPSILTAMGIGWVLISGLFLVSTPMSVVEVRARIVELAKFGIPRVPGDLLQLALFALPGILLAHIANVTTAGMVAFGIAALRMVGSGLTPISFVLLPVASRLFARGSVDELRHHVLTLGRITLVSLGLGTAVLELFAGPIVTAYLGPQFASSTGVLRLLMIGAVPWGLFVTLKSVIDARHFQAINARNTVVAFVSFLVVAGMLHLVLASPTAVVLGFVVSLYVLAILTISEVYRATRPLQAPQGVYMQEIDRGQPI